MSQSVNSPDSVSSTLGQYGTGKAARAAIRSGQHNGPTSGMAPGYIQTNLVILPEKQAADFKQFCHNNPKPCPVIDITDSGSPYPTATVAAGADLRVDLPRYRLYKDGAVVDEPTDITPLWRSDAVAFLLGCSFSFEQALLAEGLPVRHMECGRNVPMYRTSQPCISTGIFEGPMVVSMRPIPAHQVDEAVQITKRYPQSHGEPVHVGDPEALGIIDLAAPDYGDSVPIHTGEVPVFWACGVTPQAIAQAIRIPWMITHAPGHMFITDLMTA